MADKPDIALARWADGGSANITAPPALTRDNGFQGSTPALSGQVNALLHESYLWALYLDEGELEGDHVIDGALEVTGAVTVTDNATVGGTLGVTGLSTFTGAATFNGGISGPLKMAVLSPAALSAGNNNNYNPTGLGTAVIVRLTTAGGAPHVTGIAGGVDGRILHIWNVGADTISFDHQDGSSTAANQLLLPTGAAMNMATNQSISFVYDGTTARWRVLSKNF